MDVFIAWDGDGVKNFLDRLATTDEEEELRRAGRDVERGNAIVTSWVIERGGSTIVVFGDGGRARVPADALEDLPSVRTKYAQVVGSSTSVGVGVRMNHADHALRAAKMRGGGTVVFFTPEIAEEIAADHRDEESLDKYLGKAEAPSPPEPQATAAAGSPSAGGGFVERPQPGGAGEVEGQPAPADGGMVEQEGAEEGSGPTSAEAEDSFHQLAQSGAQEDDAAQAAQGDMDATKRRVVEVLQQVRQQAPKFEAIKGADPELYAALQGVVASLILTARALVGQQGDAQQQDQEQPVAKAELPLPENGPTKHILNLPVGANRRGKVKVRHGDGRTTWVSVRAGQVLSADDAHPISARNPGGR